MLIAFHKINLFTGHKYPPAKQSTVSISRYILEEFLDIEEAYKNVHSEFVLEAFHSANVDL